MCSSVDTHQPFVSMPNFWGVSARSVTASIYRTTKLAVEIQSCKTATADPTTSNAKLGTGTLLHQLPDSADHITHIKHTVAQYHNPCPLSKIPTAPVVAPRRHHYSRTVITLAALYARCASCDENSIGDMLYGALTTPPTGDGTHPSKARSVREIFELGIF